MGLYGKMTVGQLPGLSGRAPDRALGRQPGHVRHPPDAVRQRGAGARRDARRRRSARDQPRAAGRPPPAVRPGTDLVRRAGAPSPSLRGRPRRSGVPDRAHHAAPTGCASARRRGRSSARPTSAACPPTRSRRFADLYVTRSPALVKCGWGLERNRNGGSAAAAVLALPAVAGKFGVRGGGYSMSNSAVVEHRADLAARSGAADARDQHESSRPRADRRRRRAADQGALRLQLQSGGHDAEPERGAARTRSATICSRSSSIR